MVQAGSRGAVFFPLKYPSRATPHTQGVYQNYDHEIRCSEEGLPLSQYIYSMSNKEQSHCIQEDLPGSQSHPEQSS